jgi:hypothetical protein
MPTVDHEHHDLVLRIIVIGGSSELFANSLPLVDGELSLGEFQGWHPKLIFSVFPLDPWAGDGASATELERLVPYVDAVVLTDALAEGTHYSSSAVEHLSRTLAPVKIGIPSAIFGGPALTQEWETLSGRRPIIVTEPTEENAMAVVKALAKILLRSKMKSTPPPPAAG